VDAVADLTEAAYREVLGDRLGDGYLAELRDVARRAREAVVLVAVDGARDEAGGPVVGSVTYVPGPGPWAEFEGDDEAGIRILAVHPAAQGRGVGTALVEACIALARLEGRRRLSLHTVSTMAPAMRLYERLGFRRAPERDWPLESGTVLLAYVLDLS
jgi:ribosomal protein S18 acetylase RimI-like enzyme